MSDRRNQVLAGAIALALMLFAPAGEAQTLAGNATPQSPDTRARLEAAARAADSAHRGAEAQRYRERLEHGDFEEGEKIIVTVDVAGVRVSEGAASAPIGGVDTAVVRAGKMLSFAKVPNVPPVSLVGVLRSELADTLTHHLSRYLRNPTVTATPLLRVAVMGAVAHPGWYSTPADVALADVIMQAGGVNAESDMSNTIIRRGGDVLWRAGDVRQALAAGFSLDRLQVREGDEVFVATGRHWSLTTTVQVLTTVVAAFVAVRMTRQH